jgi:hypothetical protein
VLVSHIIWYISGIKKVKTFFRDIKVMLFYSPKIIVMYPCKFFVTFIVFESYMASLPGFCNNTQDYYSLISWRRYPNL